MIRFCPVCGGILSANEPILMVGAYPCRCSMTLYNTYPTNTPSITEERVRQIIREELHRAWKTLTGSDYPIREGYPDVTTKPNHPLVEDENAAGGPASDTPGTPAGDA